MKTNLLLALLCSFVQGPSDLASNPVLRSFQTIGDKGLPPSAAGKSNAGKFKPSSNSSSLDGLLKTLLDDESERKVVAELTKTLIEKYEEGAKPQGTGNDVAGATAFALTVLVASVTEGTISEAGLAILTKQLQAAMNPEVLAATDAQRQQVYELSLTSAALALIATQSETPEGKKQAKAISSSLLRMLTGATPDQLKVEGGKVRIVPRPAPVASKPTATSSKAAAAEGVAPNFSFAMPAGWEVRQGWYARDKVESRWEGHREVTGASVRILPAIPAGSNMGSALGDLWKRYLPAEAQGKQSGMVYRRFVGDRIFAQFIFGLVQDKGRDVDTAYTLLLLDCKTHWQPVIVAGTFDENTAIRSTVRMAANSSYDDSAAIAEELLQTFRCPSAVGTPIATVEALAGDYSFGTTSTLWTENIYTGATSMNYVASGGTLTLKPNGRFAWKANFANGRDGAMKKSSITATGRWTIEGDMLHLVYETYDQGDSYKAKDKRYRIAGLTTFADGGKVAVLMYHTEYPVNLTTVGDRGDWYTTKKG